MRSLCFWCELISSDLLLMYINQFQGQRGKVTFEMLSQELDLYASKCLYSHETVDYEKNR